MQVKVFSVNYFAENTYVLYDDTGEAVIIDCGCAYPTETALLECFLKEQQLQVVRHLGTHYHADHLLGAGYLFRKHKLSPEMHKGDAILPTIEEQARILGLMLREEVPMPQWTVQGGDIIIFGHTTLRVLEIPGHSPGSVGYYCEAAGQIYVGDALFCGSIGRTDLWHGNYDQLIHSIQEVLFALPGDTVVYPGHGPTTTIQYEQTNNPYI